ncbi:hypothetical protein PbB2_00238 [Candidatus Phycosocius bacilliformis]|uniref:Uncharacterized protein n=1 Tax=Candidatus Phycosocius bacilliformis TaxID=1445552 RepID=A0A2P2E683_9PROT|nr:hypothetical protein PbB2_00238 [Candidatus Phycosocius bacilliformis]
MAGGPALSRVRLSICGEPKLDNELGRPNASAAIMISAKNRTGCNTRESYQPPAIRSTMIRQQDFAFAGMVGRTDHAFLFHALNQAGGAVIAQ